MGLGAGTLGIWWAFFAGVTVQAVWVGVRWWRGAWWEVALRRSRVWRLHLADLGAAERDAFLDGVRAPAMAVEGTRELIDADSVRYVREGAEVARWTPPARDAAPAS